MKSLNYALSLKSIYVPLLLILIAVTGSGCLDVFDKGSDNKPEIEKEKDDEEETDSEESEETDGGSDNNEGNNNEKEEEEKEEETENNNEENNNNGGDNSSNEEEENTSEETAAVVAFPGAEGFGAKATGGRGGRVIKVTNLNADGPGSLQDALNQDEPRIIVFGVSGVIESDIYVNYGNVTVAGQTAPGGITIKGRLIGRYRYGIDNMIFRHLRIRPVYDGSVAASQFDGIQFSRNNRLIFDHISVCCGVDETFDLYEADDVTVQWSTIESADLANNHNFGLINGPDGHRISVHHNLFAHNKNRNPAIANGPADVINNVAYNVRHGFIHHNPASGQFNIVGNYYKDGPSATLFPFYFDDKNIDSSVDPSYYLFDNYVEDSSSPCNGSVLNPWQECSQDLFLPESHRSTTSFDFRSIDSYVSVTRHSSTVGYDLVLEKAGAFPRDVITKRSVQELIDGTGAYDSRYPSDLLEGISFETGPIDNDNDGMGDAWELENGLNPNNGNDHGTVMPNGYTAIEVFINKMADLKSGTSDGDSESPDPEPIPIPVPTPEPQPEPEPEPTPDPTPTPIPVPTQVGEVHGMMIPESHPRLVFSTKQKLDLARSRFALNPFTPRSNDIEGHAYRYLMTGDMVSARIAIDYVLNYDDDVMSLYSTSGQKNLARWHGETISIVYDWCHDAMTADERALIISRWNGHFQRFNEYSWGSPEMPWSNFYWGFLRNSLEWGIVTYHENDEAEKFINHGLNDRFRDTFIPFAETGFANGGVPVEGSHYGTYAVGYMVAPLMTMKDFGLNLFEETGFYQDAVYYYIYATTPARTTSTTFSDEMYFIFPFADDGDFRADYRNAFDSRSTIGNFMTMMSLTNGDTNVGRHARDFLNRINPGVTNYIQAIDVSSESLSPHTLSLDHYAKGSRILNTRNHWGTDSMVTQIQMNTQPSGSHEQNDTATFQIWRSGKWLSRETVSYTDIITDWKGIGSIPARKSIGHNSILFEGFGQAGAYVDGPPVTTRLESTENYSYTSVNMSEAYRAHHSTYISEHETGTRLRDDNAHAKSLVREFLFIRPLETFVVFDRMESSAFDREDAEERRGVTLTPRVLNAEDVTKTFVLHFEQNPILEASNVVSGVNGDQELFVKTVYPETVERRVIDEGGSIGQYRLEVDQSGSAQGYFLHVLQGKDTGAENVTTNLMETDTKFVLTISHSAGTAIVEFEKGMLSTGGRFGFSVDSFPSLNRNLRSDVQNVNNTVNGPVFE